MGTLGFVMAAHTYRKVGLTLSNNTIFRIGNTCYLYWYTSIIGKHQYQAWNLPTRTWLNYIKWGYNTNNHRHIHMTYIYVYSYIYNIILQIHTVHTHTKSGLLQPEVLWITINPNGDFSSHEADDTGGSMTFNVGFGRHKLSPIEVYHGLILDIPSCGMMFMRTPKVELLGWFMALAFPRY